MTNEMFKKEAFKKSVKDNVKFLYRKTIEEATQEQIFQAVSYTVKDVIIDNWLETQKAYDEQDPKTVYYMSMEFLMGRALGNNLINLCAYGEVKEALDELGFDLNCIEDQEPDPALGNGGLGRLAACFLDSLATLNYSAYGCGIRYHYGMFKQKIENGYQIEVPDNWLWGMSYNLPIDELAQVMSNAIDNGYTFAWASDVSERGFQTSQPGVAVVPTTDTKEMSGAEIAKWEAMPKGNQTPDAFRQGPAPEKEITQEMRQQEFDNYLTTDDHGMHVIGKAKDQNGTVYYIVKNSWNKYNKFGGYFYASEPFMKYKTMNIIVHKNAIPKDIRKKLGIK